MLLAFFVLNNNTKLFILNYVCDSFAMTYLFSTMHLCGSIVLNI